MRRYFSDVISADVLAQLQAGTDPVDVTLNVTQCQCAASEGDVGCGLCQGTIGASCRDGATLLGAAAAGVR